MRLVHTLATNLGYLKRLIRVRFRLPLLQQPASLWSSYALVVTAFAPEASLIPIISVTSLVFLALLGGVAAHAVEREWL